MTDTACKGVKEVHRPTPVATQDLNTKKKKGVQPHQRKGKLHASMKHLRKGNQRLVHEPHALHIFLV